MKRNGWFVSVIWECQDDYWKKVIEDGNFNGESIA